MALTLFSILLALLIHTAASKSVAYDEIIYAPAGLLYWQTGLSSWNIEHPPLQKLLSALPWVTQKLKLPPAALLSQLNSWTFGYLVLFHNIRPASQLLMLSRIPSLVITLFLALGIFFLAWSQLGFSAGLIALSVTIFDPLLLANGTLAMNDIFVTAFFFFTFFFFYFWLKNTQKIHFLLISGLSCGMAIGSKFSGFLILPALFFISYFSSSEQKSLKQKLWGPSVATAVGLLFLLTLYRFNLPLLKNSFVSGFAFHGKVQIPGFLHGPIPPRSGWFYYPIALLIKTPLPLLTLWILAWVVVIKRSPEKRFLLVFGIPAAIVLTSALLSQNHFGLRYLLLMMPCLAILVGASWPTLLRQEKMCYVLLLVWLAVETGITHPNHMAYFNELVGGSKKGYEWLDGSNQDWGQDLIALSEFWQKQNKPPLLLCYVGSGRPEAWGLSYQDVLSPAITSAYHEQIIHPFDVKTEMFAVSANLRAHPEIKYLFEWLNDKKPVALLGNTIFVYDISTDAQSVRKIAELYQLEKNKKAYKRQLLRLNYLQQKI